MKIPHSEPHAPGCLLQTRVVLADIMMKPPHVLMLDEPSNHLDLDTIAALTQALSDFDGGVILVSHDRQLVAEVRRACPAVPDRPAELFVCLVTVPCGRSG